MLVAQGGRVILADVNPQGEQLAAELGVNARFVVADVTDPKSAQAAIDACLTTFGNLRGLVNCAGIAPGEKVVGKEGAHSLDTFARAININLIGSFNMLRLAAKAMTEQSPLAENERGVIVNTASIAAFEGQIGQAAYSASKGGVVAMTLPIARELARHGIRVMAIAPGVFETPMLMGLPENVREALGQSVPYPPRLGRPAEFAGLVQHIMGNLMLNGEVIRLDGAIRVQPR
nr:H426 [uncultured bacterium]